MAVESGFFASLNGDRKYGSEDLSNFLLNLITDGVLASPEDNLKVTAISGSTGRLFVIVVPGWGAIKAKYIHNTGGAYTSISNADPDLPRIDRVVLRLDPSERQIKIVSKTGTPAETPVPPALTRVENGVWELSLAQIFIAPGVTSLSQSVIIDERADESVCGYITWVGGLPDTSELTERMGGISFVKLNREEYDALTVKDENTEYFVTETDGSTKIYFGESELGGGSSTKSVTLSVSPMKSFSAVVTKEE